MLVDGFPCYDYSPADILPVDDFSIAIAILSGLRSRSGLIVPWTTNKNQFTEDVSKFELALDTAIRAFEELRFSVIKNKQVSGGSDLYCREELPSDELSISIAILNNAKIRAELSISNLWGQSLLDPGEQEVMDTASYAMNQAIDLLKNCQK